VAESFAASAVLTASGAYVHSGVGPASSSLNPTATAAQSGSAALVASGSYVASGFGPPSNSVAPSATVAIAGSAVLGVSALTLGTIVFELGTTPLIIELVDADIGAEGPPVFGTTSLAIEPVPIGAFGSEGFEFGVTDIGITPVPLDPAGGDGGLVGILFELGVTEIELVNVSIELDQTFAPFEFGTTPLTLTPVDAEIFARPPATLAPSDSGIDLAPTTREFEPPRYAVTFERSMSGLTEAILWGSKPGGAKMMLGYETIADEFAELWMKTYDESRELLPVVLPDEVYSGLSVGLKAVYNLTKYGLSWFFVGPPKVESVTRGYSALDVELEGRNARALPYSASGFTSPNGIIITYITTPGDVYTALPDGDLPPDIEEPEEP